MNPTDEALDVDEIVGIVQRCPSVVRLAAGTGVEVATYLPGRRVPGVRVGDGTVDVHVVARYGKPLPEVADEVRRALGASIGRRQIGVFIDDLDLDEQPATQGGLPA